MSEPASQETTPHTSQQSLRNRYESVRPVVKNAVEKAFQRGKSRKDISAIREGAFHAAEAMQEEAYMDGLTGLYRRKPFQEFTEKAMENVVRNPGDTGILMTFMDLDNYGRFNKDFGETAGDQTLATIGKTIKGNIRQTDIAGRWGGEEIAVTHVYTPDLGTSPIAAPERLRELIKGTDIPLKGGEITEHITASFGATEYVPGESFDELRERAGLGMRLAKMFGKNRTVHVSKRPDGKIFAMDYQTGNTYIYESEIADSESNPGEKELKEYLTDLTEQTRSQIVKDKEGKKYTKILEVYDKENPMDTQT